MPIGKRNFITKEQFNKLRIGQKVLIRYMIGEAYVAGKPTVKTTKDAEGNPIKRDCIDIEFKGSGPWKGKTLNLARQQIAHKEWGKKSFPPR